MRLAQLQADQARLSTEAAADREALASVRPERDQFEFQYLQAAASADALLAKLDTALQALNDAKVALAAQDRQLDMLGENMQASRQKADSLALERDGLLRENAGMAARLALLIESKEQRDL